MPGHDFCRDILARFFRFRILLLSKRNSLSSAHGVKKLSGEAGVAGVVVPVIPLSPDG